MSVQTKSREPALEVSSKGPVRLRVRSVDATTAIMEIGVDYAQAPVPHLNYDADYCDVVQGRTGITFVFGKLKAGSGHLRTKIEITFSEEHFYRQVWGTSRDLHRIVEQSGHSKLSPVESFSDTDKVQCLRANNVFMAVLGEEAVLDFYYISPGDVHLARQKQKKEIALDAVVRVVVSTAVLVELLEKCKPFADRLRDRFKEEEL
jgi:hypothetical protein